MVANFFITILFVSVASARAKNEDLPLCPTNYQFFPQHLPMHCRMPTAADFPAYPGIPGFPTAQPPVDAKPPMPMPVPMPPGMPGPVPMPMPGPGSVPMPGQMMPMPISLPGSGHKLPVIVMPFYSPDTSFKKPRRPKKPGGPGWKQLEQKLPLESAETSSQTDAPDSDTDTDTDTDNDSSSDNGWWNQKKRWRKNGRRSGKRHSHRSKRRHNKKRDLLTPVLQYVTKDGYVIYEKTISKSEAKDWLSNREEQRSESQNGDNKEELNENVHVVLQQRNVDVEEENSRRDQIKEDEDKDEVKINEDKKINAVTTPRGHGRRHHRKESLPINKILPNRS